jgi:biotin-(acetyl-CoA carboxylase) ligase
MRGGENQCAELNSAICWFCLLSQINVHENMHQHSDASLRESATSIAQALAESGSNPHSLSRESILAGFANAFEELKTLRFEQVLKEYQRYDMLLNQPIIVMPKKKEEASAYYEAIAMGYSQEGYLVVRTQDGATKELVAEEVTIRPSKR